MVELSRVSITIDSSTLLSMVLHEYMDTCKCKAWFTICRKGLATHALTLAATQPIAGIDSNSIPTFSRVAFKRQIEKFCVDSINSSLAKFNATPLRHIVNQA